ncbi:hypothetical protein [Chitinimonas sp. BJB300]|uniref:hypothetical protein n=1 Tax=Chitinimonas sp. BJB300 TaxID=1559339 RepID=UPI000C10D4EE|nr:hypothetical protein [Chitinimonas sp. BJB300]PHV12397.1 hypothetical protein CSQ89_05775 [Chitinimonas sp. BJB300]TSJ88993.1 hypothetical protein FG002_008895 [Chitinimonas sp. BJB300]
MKSLLIAAALISTAAMADEPATAQPAAAKHSCAQPELPGKLASEMKKKSFTKRFKEYGECMKKYIDDQSAAMKAANDAGNAAISEYNTFVKQVNDESNA